MSKPKSRIKLKSEMVAYVEKNLCRINIFTKNYFGGTNLSHILNTNRSIIMGIHLRKCYIAYRYHNTTERNTFFEVVHFTPEPLPEVKPKLQKKSYAVIKLMVMTIYLSCIDRYPCFIKSNKIFRSVATFVNEGQASKVPP